MTIRSHILHFYNITDNKFHKLNKLCCLPISKLKFDFDDIQSPIPTHKKSMASDCKFMDNYVSPSKRNFYLSSERNIVANKVEVYGNNIFSNDHNKEEITPPPNGLPELDENLIFYQ